MFAGKNGVTTNTPKRTLFGAGTIHRGLKYAEESWNFAESIVGATSGGSSLSIVPEIVTVEADGALVATKGLNVKVGETATLEVNFLELTPEIIQAALLADMFEAEMPEYQLFKSKSAIVEGDYWDNIAFVGKTLEGRDVIAILDNALCTSGMELGGENKKETVGKYTFACHADLTDDAELDTLPWRIYYPRG